MRGIFGFWRSERPHFTPTLDPLLCHSVNGADQNAGVGPKPGSRVTTAVIVGTVLRVAIRSRARSRLQNGRRVLSDARVEDDPIHCPPAGHDVVAARPCTGPRSFAWQVHGVPRHANEADLRRWQRDHGRGAPCGILAGSFARKGRDPLRRDRRRPARSAPALDQHDQDVGGEEHQGLPGCGSVLPSHAS